MEWPSIYDEDDICQICGNHMILIDHTECMIVRDLLCLSDALQQLKEANNEVINQLIVLKYTIET